MKSISEAWASTVEVGGLVKPNLRLDRAASSAVASEVARWTSLAMQFACLFLVAGITIPAHAESTLSPGRNYAQELVNQTLAVVLRDASGKSIGAIAFVFPYGSGDDEKRAEAIRDELGKQIESVAFLVQPRPVAH